MKYSISIDPEREEEVLIYARERSCLVERIEGLLKGDSAELLGYFGDEIVKLTPTQVECFFVEDGRVFAICKNNKYLIRQRLYQVEKGFGRSFLRINQSCIVNVDMIERFGTSIGGSLMVQLKGGYKDYVLRRQMKFVKERIGI